MHVKTLEHEIPLSALIPAGGVLGSQVPPPSVVFTMATPGPPEEEPIAVQVIELEHEIPVKFATVAGMVSIVQDVPPLLVPMMLGEPELN
jgi:hypothetical protein